MNKQEKMKIIIKTLKKLYNTEHSITRNKFMLLIGTILSQRTRDENTARAVGNLSSKVKNPRHIISLPLNRLEKLIKPSGMYRQKALRIKSVSKIILEKYKGKVPKTRQELIELPGVGFKTADIVLSYGYGVPTIAVDTHVNRIPKRIGLVDEKAKLEDVRKELERITSERDRFIVNHGLVQFGQNVCRPVKPLCEKCLINKICKYYKTRKR